MSADATKDSKTDTPCPIDPWLMDKLVCPVTRTPLRWDGTTQELVSDAAALAFPLRDGIPLLVVRSARAL